MALPRTEEAVINKKNPASNVVRTFFFIISSPVVYGLTVKVIPPMGVPNEMAVKTILNENSLFIFVVIYKKNDLNYTVSGDH